MDLDPSEKVKELDLLMVNPVRHRNYYLAIDFQKNSDLTPYFD
jgi:hypothetical protein